MMREGASYMKSREGTLWEKEGNVVKHWEDLGELEDTVEKIGKS